MSGSNPDVALDCSNYHGLVELQMTADGKERGLFATKDVKAGTLVMVRDDEAIAFSGQKNQHVIETGYDSNEETLTKLVKVCTKSKEHLGQFYLLYDGAKEIEDINLPSMCWFGPNKTKSGGAMHLDDQDDLVIEVEHIERIFYSTSCAVALYSDGWDASNVLFVGVLKSIAMKDGLLRGEAEVNAMNGNNPDACVIRCQPLSNCNLFSFWLLSWQKLVGFRVKMACIVIVAELSCIQPCMDRLREPQEEEELKGLQFPQSERGHRRKSKREEKSSKKNEDRKRSPSSPSSSPSSSSDESSGYSSQEKQERGHRRSYAAWKRYYKLKKFKEGGKKISFLTYDGTFGATDKVLAFIQQFDAAFGDEGFTKSSKLHHVAMHFQKSARQWWASLRANGEAPKT
ncbi:hypothetical protein L7F22_025434 [Adiantum nelumboides]|nr:hypothetical protein [Adiantum nelumboides]